MRILLVEDHTELSHWLAKALRDAHLTVECADNGADADALLHTQDYALLILDLTLPRMDGLEVLKRLRARAAPRSQTPVLILTARGGLDERVQGLNLGADDYLAKPFNPDELMARVKAVLRRQSAPVPGAPGSEDESVTFGDYELSLATRELKRGDEVHMLTTGEFAVLKALVMNARQPLTRDKLMNLARGREWDALERSIDVQISRLRRMIEPDPSKPRYIQTVWGVGYVFVPDGAATK